MFRHLSAAKAAILIAAAVLTASLVAPAGGVVSHRPSLKSQVSRALKLAKAADARSRKALKLARRPLRPGPPGPPGASGTNGTGSAVATGAGVTAVDFRANPGESRVILNQGGLVLTASCTAGPNIDVRATTTVEHSIMHVMVAVAAAPPRGTAPVFAQKNDFLTTSAPQTLTGMTDGANTATGGHLSGSLTFSTPSGTVTTLTYGAEQGAFGGAAAKGCWFGGTAVTAG